jgi:uncharacterized membrane protein YgaE (UPF0421/DUF939 family)
MCFFNWCFTPPEEENDKYRNIDRDLEAITAQFAELRMNTNKKLENILERKRHKKHNASNQYKSYYQ